MSQPALPRAPDICRVGVFLFSHIFPIFLLGGDGWGVAGSSLADYNGAELAFVGNMEVQPRADKLPLRWGGGQ